MKKAREILIELLNKYDALMEEGKSRPDEITIIDQALKELKELMPSVEEMKKLVVETENNYANAFEGNRSKGTRVSAIIEAIHKLITERLV